MSKLDHVSETKHGDVTCMFFQLFRKQLLFYQLLLGLMLSEYFYELILSLSPENKNEHLHRSPVSPQVYIRVTNLGSGRNG